MIAFRIDERIGAGFQADGTFKFFLKKFLEACKDGGQCELHDEKMMMMLVMCCCVLLFGLFIRTVAGCRVVVDAAGHCRLLDFGRYL